MNSSNSCKPVVQFKSWNFKEFANGEDLQLYRDALNASDGFDVPSLPRLLLCHAIAPIPDDKLNSETLGLNQLCVEAIHTFNEEKGTELYKFLKLEKANSQGHGCGTNYYLTFQAQNVKDSTIHTLQALVFKGFMKKGGSYPIKVGFCRLKVEA